MVTPVAGVLIKVRPFLISLKPVIEFTEEEEVLKNFYIEHFENNPNNEFSNFIDYIIKLRKYKKIAAAINFDY